ncbi:helix-turn-helix transcriptional regulator [Chitinophaga pinensis]|uniref:YafY family transcriptional regulator n=1 Tax=Chitinophaga pinensis TaxID=79329 RepID=A0A5C6LMU0_9BACT|nr:YafY family protein [Chitinophaga pinensis]TWV94681.1 YafY family transcriptional regulator [Chitinophaga pinensis]
MPPADIKRLTRLTAILIRLQTKKIVTAAELAMRFDVSVRTIYRDIRTLEQAGVPVITEEGLGYSLMDGYRIPPVMFTEEEANALITAEEIISGNRDASFIMAFKGATAKIKALLRETMKEKVNLLQDRTIVKQDEHKVQSSSCLSQLQISMTNSQIVKISYTDEHAVSTDRIIEPFAFYGTKDIWLIIAYCRLRQDFRAFRLDRISKAQPLQENFTPQKMTLSEFFQQHYNTSDI